MRYLFRYLLRREMAYILITLTSAALYYFFGPHLGLPSAAHHR